jgi:uncharacterized protein (PEP-CTERM system associated)
MAAERKPPRHTTALRAALPCAGLLLLVAPRAAHAFTPADTGTSGGPSLGAPFPNSFPDAGTAGTGTTGAGTGTGTTGTGAVGAGAGATPTVGGLLPPDYRYQGTLPVVMGGLPAPGITVVPTVTLQEEFTDNVLQTETNRRWDLVTLLTPGLTIGANTPRLNLSLQYAPTLEYYARTSSQDAIAQQAYGVGNLVIVPDTLFLNGTVFATVAPINGGYAGTGIGGVGPVTATSAVNGYGAGTTGTTRQGTTQIYGASLSPYLVHQFGDIGTGTLGATLTRTSSSNSAGGGGAQEATTEDATAQFESGPVLGRVQDTVLLDASRTQGTGVLGGSQQDRVSDRLAYALFHQLHVFGELGYENIRYSGVYGQHIEGATWRLGFTFIPNPDSQVTVSYGYDYGTTSFQASANYALTARTTLVGGYDESVTTYLQQIANGLGQAGVNQNGVPIDTTTGLPLTAVNSALAVQDTVYRNRVLYVGMTTLLDRDTFGVNLDYTEQTPLSTLPGGGTAQHATTINGTWARALSERATASAAVSYGVTSASGTFGNNTLFSLSGQYVYALTPTITTSASYLFFRRRSTAPGFSMYENVVFVGITKRF